MVLFKNIFYVAIIYIAHYFFYHYMNEQFISKLKENYCLSGNIYINQIGSGHINDTYLVKSSDSSFILQRINSEVFFNPIDLLHNFKGICTHLQNMKQHNIYTYEVPFLLSRVSGEYFFIDEKRDYWRALSLIKNSCSYDFISDRAFAFEAAKAFAGFTFAFNDIDVSNFKVIINDFHNLRFRLQELEVALNQAKKDNFLAAKEALAFVTNLQPFFLNYLDNFVENGLQVRLMHNDTKINNVLFCKDSIAAKAVIDLDTFMPGYLLYDFGDMARTVVPSAPEDSLINKKINLRLNIFQEIIKGYSFHYKQSSLATAEIDSLRLAAPFMSFMVGVRFLTDFLSGNVYFKVKYDKHNLHRSENQFALAKIFLENKDLTDAIIDEHFK